nr:conserved hypothetical protein [Serratia symbiotica]
MCKLDTNIYQHVLNAENTPPNVNNNLIIILRVSLLHKRWGSKLYGSSIAKLYLQIFMRV